MCYDYGMDTKKLKVHKHNDLIQARYSAMSLQEQMILLACIASVDPRTLRADTPVDLTVAEFADLIGINQRGAYDDLRRAVRRLYDRSVTIDNHDHQTETRWVASVRYYKSQGRIQLYFAHHIIPYLADLKSNYTAFFLRHVAQFKSVYGVRLYELLTQWQSKGEREVTVEWLRKKWMLEDKYKDIKDLKKRALDPAMRDINTYSNLWVKMGQRKLGRQIVAFQFQFGLKSTAEARAKLEDENTIPKRLTRRYVEQHAKPGESYDAAYARLRRERDEQHRAAGQEEDEQPPPKRKRRRGKRNDEELQKMREQLALKIG